MKIFSIDGYWKDDHSEFSDLWVKEDETVDPKDDDTIFYYGLSEEQIKEAIKLGKKTDLEFVITGYTRIK